MTIKTKQNVGNRDIQAGQLRKLMTGINSQNDRLMPHMHIFAGINTWELMPQEH